MNMRLAHFLLSLVVVGSAMTGVAQSSDAVLRDKITNAVMKVYDDQLAKDPNDYNTLFARAHQHYYNGDYTSALADVNQALLITPKTDSELRFDEYILRARISDARKDYVSELADLRLAQEIQPKSLACTDLIAKANLKAGNLNAAEKAFKTILRAESMNYDAMYGLAQVEIARGNSKAALEHVDKAVELFRTEPQVYITRADINARQNKIDAAVNDLILGMSVGDGGNAVQSLFDLSDVNYDAVMQSLANLADKTNDSGLYHYLRASIAMDHVHYAQALKDLSFIRTNNLYDSPTLDYNMAKCCLELARFDEAIIHADKAIARDPSQAEPYIVKVLAEFNVGDSDNAARAMEILNRCSAIAPQHAPMLMTKAAILSSQGKDKEALGYMNAAVDNDPGNGEALLTRGLLLKKLDNLKAAVKDFGVMALLSDDVYDLKGIGLSELGRDNDALKWLNDITKAGTIAGGENYYYAAVFMMLRGDNYKAMEYIQKAIDNGYGSLYKLQYDNLSPLCLKSLRTEPGFDLIVEKAQRNFR